MGRRASRERSRPPPPSPTPTPPPPPPGSSSIDFANWLGHSGIILVLLETPSGFALFSFNGVKLFRPNATEVVHLKEFQIFKDKGSAISSAGVGKKLAKMIKRWLRPGQKLAVGKHEYQMIIEKSLDINCLFDGAVEELMWGLKNLMKILVPDEELELTDKDQPQMSHGLKLLLNRYGFGVEARMVNSHIIKMASAVYECDFVVNKHTEFLAHGGEQLEEVSQIDTKSWDPLKLATALKLICCPADDILTGDSKEMISPDMKQTLVEDAHKYKGMLNTRTCSAIYKDIASAYELRRKALKLLASMVKEGKEESKMHQGCLTVETEKKIDN